MNFDYLHEAEDIELSGVTSMPCTTLWEILKRRGYRLYDDIYALDRMDRANSTPWQSDTYVSVYIYKGEEEVYDRTTQWDRVILRYILATQPRSGIAVFCASAADISSELQIPMTFRGEVVDPQQLEQSLNVMADELTREISEPGSEDVAIMIESTYPRR